MSEHEDNELGGEDAEGDIGQPESASSMIGQPESPGHTASAETDAVAVAAPASGGGGGGQEDELQRAKARVGNGQYASEGYLERAPPVPTRTQLQSLPQ